MSASMWPMRHGHAPASDAELAALERRWATIQAVTLRLLVVLSGLLLALMVSSMIGSGTDGISLPHAWPFNLYFNYGETAVVYWWMLAPLVLAAAAITAVFLLGLPLAQ